MLIPTKKLISVTSWNIGYCGLGKEEEFFVDGGKRIFPRSKENILKNLSGVKKEIRKINSDIYLLQEVSKSFSLTKGVDIFKGVKTIFSNFELKYFSEFKARFLSSLDVGKTISSKYFISDFVSPKLLLDPSKFISLILLKKMEANSAVYNIEGSMKKLIVGNIHLSAFDAKAKARKTQLCNLVKFMNREYKKGNYIIMGGDWNFVLNKVNYEHETEEKHLFWVYDFPNHILSSSLHVVSGDCPTVRTTNKPYIRGENFTAVVDGYLVSPNVEVVSCKTSNLNFEFSDHNPVTLNFRLKESNTEEGLTK